MLRLVEDKWYIQAMITAFMYGDVVDNISYCKHSYNKIVFNGRACIIDKLTIKGFTYVAY